MSESTESQSVGTPPPKGPIAEVTKLIQVNRLDEAKSVCDKLIENDSEDVDALYALGWIALCHNEIGTAEKHFRRVIELKPDHARARYNLGTILMRRAKLTEAAVHFEAAATDRNFPDAFCNLASIRIMERRFDAAIENFRAAIAINPGHAEAHYGLGNALVSSARAPEAVEHYQKAIAINPEFADAHNALGNCFMDLERLDDAEACFEKALEHKSDFVHAHTNLAIALHRMMRLDEAVASFHRALALDPAHDKARINLGMMLLLLGRFKEAWPLYEFRPNVQEESARAWVNPESVRNWKKSDLGGEPLLARGEQGLGDEIMFSSIMPDILAVQPHVTLISEERLVGLFRRSFPGLTVVPRPAPDEGLGKDLLPEKRCFIGSLMRFFRCQREDFPGTPYLLADPDRRKEMRARLDVLGNEAKIGIMWRGGVGSQRERLRSLSLDDFVPLFHSGAANWVSLNHLAEAGDEIAAFGERTGITIHHWPEILRSDDYDDTAALLAELDAVVSVTCSVAHCAAALGVPTHVLVDRLPAWRYGCEGAANPWYGAMTLYRQTDHWPIEQVVRKLGLARD